MRTINGIDILTTVRINYGRMCFDLNPYCINLKTGYYQGKGFDIMTDDWEDVPNLKYIIGNYY